MEFMSSIAPLSVAGLVAAIALLAMRLQFSNRWRPFAFSCWVLVVVVVALGYPSVFQTRDGQPASYLIMPLIQLIMFGMGTTLGWRTFDAWGLATRRYLLEWYCSLPSCRSWVGDWPGYFA